MPACFEDLHAHTSGADAEFDGIDVESCSDVPLQSADIECIADTVAIKAGRDADELRVNRPTETWSRAAVQYCQRTDRNC
jgi:polygalacturonase